jgi:hypothetical protein
MQSCCFFWVLHDFAEVQKLHINDMHVYISTFVFLHTKVRFFEGWLENYLVIVIYCVFGCYIVRLLLFVLVSQLFSLIIEILPNDLSWFLLLWCFQTFLTFDYQQLLFLELGLLSDKGQCTFRSLLDHRQEVIDTMLSNSFLFGIILNR